MMIFDVSRLAHVTQTRTRYLFAILTVTPKIYVLNVYFILFHICHKTQQFHNFSILRNSANWSVLLAPKTIFSCGNYYIRGRAKIFNIYGVHFNIFTMAAFYGETRWINNFVIYICKQLKPGFFFANFIHFSEFIVFHFFSHSNNLQANWIKYWII